MISEFTQLKNLHGICWNSEGKPFEKHFANEVMAICLKSCLSILIVEPASDEAPNNAWILNQDGSIRKQIENPHTSRGAIGFGDAYYVGDELTLIICFSSLRMGCVIDENGNILKVYEGR